MTKTALGFFWIILGGALLSSLLGGAFALAIASISPEFVRMWTYDPSKGENITGYAVVLGMVWGLFIGASVAGFACFLSMILQLIRLRIELTNTKSAS